VGALRALEEHKGDLVFPDGIYGASVGGFLAVAIAFHMKLDAIRRMYDKYFTASNFFPDPTLDGVLTIAERKGMFSMDTLMQMVVEMFLESGVDLRGKRCCDAPQKLFIIASNMTTGSPTLLTGRVPILDALRCSAAIPLLFEPQMLYGDVYLDGGVHLRCLGAVVPKETIVIHTGL
jgi:predicted acylesterase/phospholipase RssA